MHRPAPSLLIVTGLVLMISAPRLARASDSSPSPRPELVPADVPVEDLGQSTRLEASIPFDPALGSAVMVAALGAAGPPPLPAPDQPGSLLYPLALPAQGLDPWGWRFSESRGRWRMHTGLDLMAPRGTPVLAALPGRVHLVAWIDGYGLTVVLDHGDGRRTLYAHLDAVAVRPGQDVRGGEVLAQVGMTGRTSGPHLHFELRSQESGRWLAHDPTPLLPAVRSLPLLAADRDKGPQTISAAVVALPGPPPMLPPLVASESSRAIP